MNENLENLIDLALVDGEISDKEKKVIYQKAKQYGISNDEIDIILEAKLHQKFNENKKIELVSKCPSCGEIRNSLSKVCNSCGYLYNREAKNAKSAESIILDLEKNIVLYQKSGLNKKAKKDIENEFNKNLRILESSYSSSKEIRDRIAGFKQILSVSKEKDKKVSRVKLYVVGLLSLVLLSVTFYFYSKPSEYESFQKSVIKMYPTFSDAQSPDNSFFQDSTNYLNHFIAKRTYPYDIDVLHEELDKIGIGYTPKSRPTIEGINSYYFYEKVDEYIRNGDPVNVQLTLDTLNVLQPKMKQSFKYYDIKYSLELLSKKPNKDTLDYFRSKANQYAPNNIKPLNNLRHAIQLQEGFFNQLTWADINNIRRYIGVIDDYGYNTYQTEGFLLAVIMVFGSESEYKDLSNEYIIKYPYAYKNLLPQIYNLDKP